jgi:flagellar hook-length control protein FliK
MFRKIYCGFKAEIERGESMIQSQSMQYSLTDMDFSASVLSSKSASTMESGKGFSDILSSVSSDSRKKEDLIAKADSSSKSSDADTSDKKVKADTKDTAKTADGNASDTSEGSADVQDTEEKNTAGSSLAAELIVMMNIQNQDTEVNIQEEGEGMFVQSQDEEVITEALPVTAETVIAAVQEAPDVVQTAEPEKVQEQTAASVGNVFEVKTDTGNDVQVTQQTEPQDTGVRQNNADTQMQQSSTGESSEGKTETEFTVTVKSDNAAAGDEKNTAEELVTEVQTDRVQDFQSETVEVKVSDGAKLEQHIVNQTADTITAKISEGSQEFEMTLTPEALGKVMIKLVFEEGSVQVNIKCSSSEAQRALASNAEAVRQIIESNTGMEAAVNVEEPDEKFGNYEDQRNSKNQEEGQEHHSDEQRSDESDTVSFIQQLRLGLVGELEAV